MIYILHLLFSLLNAQPCTTGTEILTTSTSGICVVDATEADFIILQPAILDGLNEFTITLWFRPLTKVANRQEQALFRISADTSDVTLATVNGVRLGMYFTADSQQNTQISIRYSKSSTNSQQFIQGFQYNEEKWCFVAAGLSYTSGKVFYYAWQPDQASLQVNPQPVTEAAGFHTSLPPTTVLQLLYWGDTYKTFCGEINTITIYPNYIEVDYKHNWLNLAFLNPTYTVDIVSAYRLEEGSGQALYDQKQPTQTVLGNLGLSSAVEASSDPTWDQGFLIFASGKYALIPAIIFPDITTVFGVSFWFRTDATISGDGDSTDLQKDLVVMKRKYQGSTEVFGLMFFTSTGTQYGTKVKINGVIYNPSTIVHLKDTWHYLTVTLLYPGAITELSKIMYDISLEDSVFQAHQVTSKTNAFQQSATDTITLGDPLNSYSNFLKLSNIMFFDKYTVYIDEDSTDTALLKCTSIANTCQTSLNSLSQSYCLHCKSNLFDDGQCVASCVPGPNAMTNTLIQNSAIKVCRSCDYKCTTCQLNADCDTCRTGFYLLPSNIACDTSANCGGTYIGNPNTGLCTMCGNGSREAGEACDDNNFVDADGCTVCVVDTGPDYKCTGSTPDVCAIRCGDGILDVTAPVEQCDDGNDISGDGCGSTCLIESTTHSCTATSPSVCSKLCGNGTKAGTEQCDDGNYVDNDGCSSTCQIEIGYECNLASPNVCTRLCGNGIQDAGEECEDGNSISNDGCSDCIIDSGWTCSGLICSKICGNGVRDSSEECDDGNIIAGDGCSSTCKVETDYVCSGGSDTAQDKCKIVPDICGDSIKKSTEECDDGNASSGDGCSKSCKIEIGFICQGGSTLSKDSCLPLCGDGKKLNGIEECDDGNTYGGDGCDEQCKLERLFQCNGGSLAGADKCSLQCGDGIHDTNEQCDDDNSDDGDGCSSQCIIESGYGCIQQTQSHDQCFKCINNCAICIDTINCVYCLSGYYELEGICYPGCPNKFRISDQDCINCPDNCDKCDQKQCIRCSYETYLANTQCYTHCPDGYYDSPNAMQGNQCISCTSPCAKCSSTNCYDCGDTYYITSEGICQSCEMGEYCLKCDHKDGSCLKCQSGYYRQGNQCKEMDLVCGDGLHHPKETCDDGNLLKDDGCDDKCKVEDKWDCVLYDIQGPDVCFRQQPPTILISPSSAFDNIIYLQFSRPLIQGIDFSKLTNVSVPELDKMKMKEQEDVNDEGIIITHDMSNSFVPYTFIVNRRNNQTVEMIFTYGLTVQNEEATIIFINASTIKDIYNWSLINTTTRRLLSDNTNNTYNITTLLPYCIHYDDLEILTAWGVSWFAFVICILGCLSSVLYLYYIGEGRTRKVLEYLQLLAMVRFINVKDGLNLQELFIRLDYFNITWMYNVFDLIQNQSDQFNVQPKFQFYGYNSNFLVEGGGRFITAFIGLCFIILLIYLVYRLVQNPTIEYYAEIALKYFKYQGFIIFFEIFFLDLIVSIILQFSNADFDHLYETLSFMSAILMFIPILILFAFIQRYLIRNIKVTRIKTYMSQYGELFDGLLFTNSFTKFYALVPYIQKFLFAVILVFVQDPTIQIITLALIRFIFYSFSAETIPIYFIELFIRDIAYDVSLTIVILTMWAFKDPNIPKSSKLTAGWAIMAVILVTMLLQMFWVRYAYQIIDRMQPPEIPDHEEIKEEEKPKEGDIHILQQAVEMQKLEHDFFGQ